MHLENFINASWNIPAQEQSDRYAMTPFGESQQASDPYPCRRQDKVVLPVEASATIMILPPSHSPSVEAALQAVSRRRQ